MREFAAATGGVTVGRTAAALWVAAGPWAVVLPVDPHGRFPDVTAVVPRVGSGTVVGLDAGDAAALRDALPDLPGAADDDRPVTLDLDGRVVVRGRDGDTGVTKTLRLTRSPVAGLPVRVAVDRTTLLRALALGCHTVRVGPGGKVVAAEGGDTTLLVAALDPDVVVAPGDSLTHSGAAATPPATASNERRMAVRHETNGHPPPPADRADAGGGAEPPDPLVEAEALRAALGEVFGRAGRLVAALKQARGEKKVLARVWAGLKQLNLHPGGAP